MNYSILTTIEEAKNVWETLSPNKSPNDLWQFRYCQYKYFNYPLHFIVAKENDEFFGLLPLQMNTDKNKLEFFGGGFFEDNKIFTKPLYEYLKKELIAQIDQAAELEWMEEFIDGIEGIIFSEYKYELDLSNFSSIDDYLEKTWSSKSRSNLRSQTRKLLDQDLQIEYDNFSDLPLMIQFNIERFGTESTFLFPHRESFFSDIVNELNAHMISISLNGKKEAIGLSVIYNDILIGVNSGRNQTINGLGKVLSIEKIKQAITVGAKVYDARVEDLGWKEAFHFEKRPQYSLQLSK